jgi:hypothetical protein
LGGELQDVEHAKLLQRAELAKMLEAEIQRPPIVFNPGIEGTDGVFLPPDGVSGVERDDGLEAEELSFLSARDKGSLDSLEYFSMDEEIVE